MCDDTTRICDRIPESPVEKARFTRRTKLLALAGGLDDIGLRARLVENVLKPTVLRCWNPDTMGWTLSVTCEMSGPDARWQFWLHPGAVPIGDAEHVREPDDALDAAHAVAAELARWG
ncbi:hypothetical protein [Actinomadura rupiterrae]|uniref:hypothetical protein n=1 Tax=Actinomadura rupiterrae TaxID=559627 RepID=UPI0020A5B8EF|nr:hypothetical protein [Actinomadura rupiterrae]MCP2337820.1 hypothetical protein [Actinomadura rupiterrae]